MVVGKTKQFQTIIPSEKESTFKWIPISLEEIHDNNLRLDASVYGIKGRHIRKLLQTNKWEIKNLYPNFINEPYYMGRFKRIYTNVENGIPFYLPSQLNEIKPKPSKYISENSPISISSLKVKKGQLLLTRSGTIGNVTLVSDTLNGSTFSDDVIRILPKEFPGYIYAYLKSDYGNTLINTNQYGAVIKHIEPDQLHSLPVPDPPLLIKKKINDLIEESFRLRDNSNRFIDLSQMLLEDNLKLQGFTKLLNRSKKFVDTSFNNFSVSISNIQNRLDGSFHIPLVRVIIDHLNKNSKELKLIGDKNISSKVLLPGRFKRIYVEEGSGVIFFGGKQLYELDPSNKKYLSLKHHAIRIREQLSLRQNMILITCSGTIGKVNIVPKHWDGWTANQHIIRVIPANEEIAGYLYAWLSSEYALPLIQRYTYGAVVNEIDDHQVAQIELPMLRDNKTQKEINDKILAANELRTKAYELEQEALRLLDKLVIHTEGN